METLLEIAKKITEMATPYRLRGGRETEDWIIAGSLMRRLEEAVKREQSLAEEYKTGGTF